MLFPVVWVSRAVFTPLTSNSCGFTLATFETQANLGCLGPQMGMRRRTPITPIECASLLSSVQPLPLFL
eukprot:scaffold396_cov352-Pavlova_lutheri.AAC.7